jgi:hypothetical protein
MPDQDASILYKSPETLSLIGIPGNLENFLKKVLTVS